MSQLSLSLYRVLYIVLLSGHSRQRDQLNAVALICSFVRLSVCPSVCLIPNCVHKNDIFSKTKQFGAMVSIDDL